MDTYVAVVRRHSEDDLEHYGVLGMKWGVQRARRKESANVRLRQKALKYDIKSAKAERKAEKIHAEQDLERANRVAKRAANLSIKSAKIRKKATEATNEFVKTNLERRAAKADFKSTSKQIKANRLSKQTGYGSKAMKYSIKSDEFARLAAKTRLKIANNELYIAKMNQKVASLSDDEVNMGKAYIDRLRQDSK